MERTILEQEIYSWIEDVWHYEPWPYNHPDNVDRVFADFEVWTDKNHIHRPKLLEIFSRLQARWDDEDLTAHVADTFFTPNLHLHYTDIERWKMKKIRSVVIIWLKYFMLPSNIVQRTKRALIQERYDYLNLKQGEKRRVIEPQISHYLDLLVTAPDTPELFDLLKKMVTHEKLTYDDVDTPSATIYPKRFDLTLLVDRLHRADQIDYDLFITIMNQNPTLIRMITGSWVGLRRVAHDFIEAMLPRFLRWSEELWQEVSSNTGSLLNQFMNLTDSKWLLRAAELHQREGMKIVQWSKKSSIYDFRSGNDALVIRMAQATLPDITSDAERDALIVALQEYPATTLKSLLPVAKPNRNLLLEALEWQECRPFVDFLVETGEAIYSSQGFSSTTDIPNSSDPRSGTLDVARIREACATISDKRIKEILKLFHKASVNMSHTITMVEAFFGWNREKVLKQAGKRQQYMVKAYGLLPIERGTEEVLERYLFLKQYAKESQRYGSQRRANERAAAEAALNNLAQIAHYLDRERLEWAMEAHLAEEVVQVGRVWEVGDYQVELTIIDDNPDLLTYRSGKTLKSVPKTVRESDLYAEMKNAKARLQEQYRRFRGVFEKAMVLGEVFSLNDLQNLNRMPTARILLSHLILSMDGMIFGTYQADQVAIEMLTGQPVPITDSVRIVHPFDLFHRDELSNWQQYMINKRIVQPFKQAFRELYLLTPAEAETRLYSNRFAGHIVNSAVATRLFQSRNWEIVNDHDYPYPKKYYRKQAIEARFKFPDVGRFFSEQSNITSDQISFHVYPNDDRYRIHEKNIIPLQDVPPLIFSEVMRDADLVVSVAQQDERALMSYESYLRRSEVITTLLDDLGLPGVKVEGHFAYVQGKLANYRVHLGSATIHIDPGNYLCIVPNRWGIKHKNLFLPFADDKDSKLSEVISKILFLLADDKIKDKSILAQIRRNTAQAE